MKKEDIAVSMKEEDGVVTFKAVVTCRIYKRISKQQLLSGKFNLADHICSELRNQLWEKVQDIK